MKTCSKCGTEKPFSEYHAKRGKPQPQCKACRAKYMVKHYKENRERERAVRKSWYEKNKLAVCEKMKAERLANPEKHILGRRLRKYGLTKEQFLEKMSSQNNSCEICNRPFAGTPYIDHCHTTGITRGLLCSQCNTGFGLFREDVAVFKKCIAYAKKYKK